MLLFYTLLSILHLFLSLIHCINNYNTTGSVSTLTTHTTSESTLCISPDTLQRIYIVEPQQHTISRVHSNGTKTVIAGQTDTSGYNDGNSTTALFNGISNCVVAVNATHSFIYVSDTLNQLIRLVLYNTTNINTLQVYTIAGQPSQYGYIDNTALQSQFYYPEGLAIYNNSQLLICDKHNHVIRSLPLVLNDVNVQLQQSVTTIAGNGTAGHTDGIIPYNQFYFPTSITVAMNSTTHSNNANAVVYIAHQNAIVQLIMTTLQTQTTAGNATAGYNNGPLATALFFAPTQIVANSDGIFIAGTANNVIRVVQPQYHNVLTIAGTTQVGGTDGIASNATFNGPTGITIINALSNNNSLYVSDDNGIRVITAVCNPYCKNNSTCTALNTCSPCPFEYSGSDCSIPSCSTNCTATGQICVAYNTCACPTGYTGIQCTTAVCTQSCINGGVCTTPDVCTCPSTYTGPSCNIPTCTQTCANGGSCSLTTPNTCNCTAQWTGTTCTTPVCPTCQNGGSCDTPGNCTCTNGWTGADCSQAICNTPCANNGQCTAPPQTCSCTAQWSGSTCTIPVCTPSCVNGNCTAPDTCTCSSGYTGTSCNTPICTQSCQNGGTCTSPNQCTCSSSYYSGTDCSIPNCTPLCGVGEVCQASNPQPICVSACSTACQHGICTGVDTCQCDTGWYDAICDSAICDTYGCYNGQCTAPDVCTCNTGYTLQNCSQPICTQGCINGQCIQPDQCQCGTNYGGSDCSQPLCNYVSSTGNYTGCLNNGTCISYNGTNSCICTAQWSGLQCDQPVCNTQCFIHGTCIAPDTCQCNNGYIGDSCQYSTLQLSTDIMSTYGQYIYIGSAVCGALIVVGILWIIRMKREKVLYLTNEYHTEFDGRRQAERLKKAKLKAMKSSKITSTKSKTHRRRQSRFEPSQFASKTANDGENDELSDNSDDGVLNKSKSAKKYMMKRKSTFKKTTVDVDVIRPVQSNRTSNNDTVIDINNGKNNTINKPTVG